MPKTGFKRSSSADLKTSLDAHVLVLANVVAIWKRSYVLAADSLRLTNRTHPWNEWEHLGDLPN